MIDTPASIHPGQENDAIDFVSPFEALMAVPFTLVDGLYREWGICVLAACDNIQCPDTQLDAGRFAVAPFQFGQENGPFLPGSRFSHDLAAVQCVTLAGWCLGPAIGQQLLG